MKKKKSCMTYILQSISTETSQNIQDTWNKFTSTCQSPTCYNTDK